MVGIGEQFEYIVRDESLHLNFGVDLIGQIRAEHAGVWTDGFEREVRELITEAVGLEATYAREACPPGLVGMSAEAFVEYVADRRLDQLGMTLAYGTENPFPWMTEQVDLNKEKNFFETKITEYRNSGSLEW